MKLILRDILCGCVGTVFGAIVGLPISFCVYSVLTAGRSDPTALAIVSMSCVSILVIQKFYLRKRASYWLAVLFPVLVWSIFHIGIMRTHPLNSSIPDSVIAWILVSLMYLILIKTLFRSSAIESDIEAELEAE